MKYGRVETEKLYFSSSEAAELVGVSVDVLHSWEKEFPELKPRKNKAGKRVYRESDIETAKKIAASAALGAAPRGRSYAKNNRPDASAGRSAAGKELLRKIRDDLQNVVKKLR
jgi:DNA-binding transcriptional MerR regulator